MIGEMIKFVINLTNLTVHFFYVSIL